MHTFNMPLDALLRIGSEWTPSFESIKRSLRSVFSSHQIRLDRGWECATEPSWAEALAVLAVLAVRVQVPDAPGPPCHPHLLEVGSQGSLGAEHSRAITGEGRTSHTGLSSV